MSLNKPSNELLLDLINVSNDTNLSFQEVSFEVPNVLLEDASGKNTEVGVNAVPLSGYTGGVVVKYNRIEVDQLVAEEDPFLIPVDGDLNDLVNALNARFQTQLTVGVDLADTIDVTQASYEPSTVLLDILTESFAYTGNTDIQVAWESIQLGEVITSYTLEGLTFNESESSFTLTLISDHASTDINDHALRFTRGFYEDGNIYVIGKSWNSVGPDKINKMGPDGSTFEYIPVVFATSVVSKQWFIDPLDNRCIIPQSLGNIVVQTRNIVTGGYNTWEDIPNSQPPVPMYSGSGLIVGDALYILENANHGSFSAQQRNISYKYTFNTNMWSEVANPYTVDSTGRYYHSAYVNNGDYIYKIGGRHVPGSSVTETEGVTIQNKCFRYHIPTDTWETIADLPTALRFETKNVEYHEGKIIVLGGFIGSTFHDTSKEVFSYDVASDVWTKLGELTQPKGIGEATLISTPTGLYWVGGFARTDYVLVKETYRLM